MMERRLLLLALALCFATAASLPSRAAQSDGVMTLMPAGALLAALDLGQAVPDTACVAKCAATRDRGKAEADSMLAQRRYYSEGQSNCWSLSGAPQCAAIRQACRDACKPNYTNACMAACEPAFQSCCAANDKTRAEREHDACVALCPATKVAVPPPPPGGDQKKDATPDKKTEWTSLVKAANSALDTIGLDKIPAERVDDMLRSLAFLQVRASMAVYGSKYTVVSGGAGRIWILTSDGKQVLLNATDADMVRGPANGEWYGAEYRNTVTRLTTLAGLSPQEAEDCIRQVRLANQRQKFGAGETLEFPPWQGWPSGARASSEHSSIRGTINGGGDFI